MAGEVCRRQELGLHIVDLTKGYAEATMGAPRAVLGARLFDVFPDNPEDPAADGVSNLYASLQRVIQIRRPDRMAIQRYDVRDTDGRFCKRYWSPLNVPVFSEGGDLIRILHEVEDVTEQVRGRLETVKLGRESIGP